MTKPRPEWHRQAQRLCDNGVSYNQIARMFNLPRRQTAFEACLSDEQFDKLRAQRRARYTRSLETAKL